MTNSSATQHYTIAALGCSGPVASHIVRGFLAHNDEGAKKSSTTAGTALTFKLLARSPDAVAARYRRDDNIANNNSSPNRTRFDIVQGSMSNVQDVANFIRDSDVCFLMTPMGKNNNPETEIAMAKRVLEGLAQANCRHLVYASVFETTTTTTPGGGTGVGILDAKREIETLIQSSGIPYTILRCGTYMEDAFDPRLRLLQAGWFLFPIDPNVSFCYTSQNDIPRFIVSQLLIRQNNQPANETINNFCDPNVYTLRVVEQELTYAAGTNIRLTPKFPVFYVFRALLPLFRLLEHRFSSVIPLMEYFDQHGYSCTTATSNDSISMTERFPEFEMTRLSQHLHELFSSTSAPNNK